MFWRKVIAITWKDLRSEFRAREIITSVLVFTLLVIVIFNFAFNSGAVPMRAVAPGMLWVTFAFAGVLSLNRTFVQEKEEGCLEGLLACPVSRDVIYTGKMLSSLFFMLVVEIVALPIFMVLFNLPVITWQIVTVTLLATFGFVTVGTLFSALAVNTKARELVLPFLFLPVVVPVLIAAVNATGIALEGGTWADMAIWLQVLGAFDAIFLVVSFLTFGFVIEE